MASDIRLKLVESLIAVAPRAEIQDPKMIVERAKVLETYVIGTKKRVNKSDKS